MFTQVDEIARMEAEQRMFMEEQWKLEQRNHEEMMKMEAMERDIAWNEAKLQQKADNWAEVIEKH